MVLHSAVHVCETEHKCRVLLVVEFKRVSLTYDEQNVKSFEKTKQNMKQCCAATCEIFGGHLD